MQVPIWFRLLSQFVLRIWIIFKLNNVVAYQQSFGWSVTFRRYQKCHRFEGRKTKIIRSCLNIIRMKQLHPCWHEQVSSNLYLIFKKKLLGRMKNYVNFGILNLLIFCEIVLLSLYFCSSKFSFLLWNSFTKLHQLVSEHQTCNARRHQKLGGKVGAYAIDIGIRGSTTEDIQRVDQRIHGRDQRVDRRVKYATTTL